MDMARIFCPFFVYTFLGDNVKKVLLFLILLCLPFSVQAFSSNAKAVVLMDMDSKRVLYSENPHYTQSVASISKVITAILAIENGKLDKTIKVGDEVLKAYGSAIYLKVGEKMKLEDLLYGLMLRSGNDAALVIANNIAGSEEKFVKMMNDKAKELGMSDTTFNNPHGLDEEDDGNISSAYDMALLMSYAMKNEDFKEIVKAKYHTVKTNKNTYKWKNKNKLLFNYKYTIGGKTGFTKNARRTLVTAASNNDLNLTVVTIQDGSDFSDHEKLYEEAFNSYKNYQILNSGSISILGEDYYKNNELYLKNDFTYPLTDSEKETINLKFELEKKRDYKNDDQVGNVQIHVGDKIVHTEDIYVKLDKTKLSFFDKLKNFFTNNL